MSADMRGEPALATGAASGLGGLVEVGDAADMIALLASDAGKGFHSSCVTNDAGNTAG